MGAEWVWRMGKPTEPHKNFSNCHSVRHKLSSGIRDEKCYIYAECMSVAACLLLSIRHSLQKLCILKLQLNEKQILL